jgi:DNA-binding FadR family transcriptional regulator
MAIVRISAAEAVVDYFRTRITDGDLKPGDRLPSERKLQEELGVSRVALREGLAQLNALGVLGSSQGRATVVAAEVDVRSLGDVFLPLAASDEARYEQDLLDTRRLLEVQGAALAANRASTADHTELEAIVHDLAGALSQPTDYLKHDERLHHRIVTASGNTVLAHFHSMLQQQLEPIVASSIANKKDRLVSLEQHRAIVRAIVAGESQGASELMASHLGSCANAY